MDRTLRGRHAGWAISALLLAGLIAGCSADDQGGEPAKAAGGGDRKVAQAGADGDVILPIDAYAFSLPQVSQVDRARQVLVQDCMRRFGFEFPFDVALDKQREAALVEDFGINGNKRRYGVTDPAAAAKYGFHSPSDVNGTRPKIDLAKEKQKGSAAQEMVLTGNAAPGQKIPTQVGGKALPKGGCRGAADAKLNPNGPIGDPAVVSQIPRDSFDRSVNDPGVLEVFSRWSACMKEKGYDYPAPVESGGDFDTSKKTVSAKEIAVAKADVACKTQTKTLEVWQAFEVAYQNEQIERHAEALKAAQADRDAQLKRAADVSIQGS
jgi:hypothetical protein